MKSYAFYVVVAVQGAMAKLPPDEVHALDRLPALKDDHVAKVQMKSKFANACYQNSGGQVLKRENGIAIEVLKYPCISAQEIFGFCQKEEFNNDVEAQKKCLFGQESTLESDYEGCVRCEEYNGLGSVEYIEATRKRIGQVKEEFIKGNKKFSKVDSQFPFPAKEGTPIKSKAQIAPDGTSDINILSYWNKTDYRLPQQAGAPLPGNNGGDDKDNKGISANETKDVQISIAYYASLSLQGKPEPSGSAKFRNVSGGTGEYAFLWIQQEYKLVVCISNAAPVQGKIDWESRLNITPETTSVEPVQEKPLYGTAQTASVSSEMYASLNKEVLYDVTECGCFDEPAVKGIEIANPASKGNGTKFITSVTIINVNLSGGEGQAPSAGAPGQTNSSNNGQGISGKMPSTEGGSGNDGITPVRPDNRAGSGAPGPSSGPSSGSSPVAPPAPVTPATETAPKGAVGGGRNATSTSCAGSSCQSGHVIVSGASVVRTSSLIASAAVLVAAL